MRQVVVHEFGKYVCDAEEEAVFNAAPRKRKGGFDRRSKAGRRAKELELNILNRERRRWT